MLSGEVLDAGGKPVSGTVVALVPTHPTVYSWLTTALTDSDGEFRLTARSGGTFHAYVLDQSQQASLNDPDYLQAHEGDFPPLYIVEGQNPPLTLHLAAK